jgi:fibronectin-binding autotransporter adhesin
MSHNSKAAQRARENLRRSIRRSRRIGLLSLAAAAALPAIASFAATDQWVGGTTGNWNNAANWSPAAVPNAGDTVNVTNTLGNVQTITYNYAGTAVSLTTLTLDALGSGTASEMLTMTANNLTVSGVENIGDSGTVGGGVALFNQSGGVNTAGSLFLASNGTDTGTYLISGGTLTVVNQLAVGEAGTGIFTAMGSAIVNASPQVGTGSGSNGTFNLGGNATLTSASDQYTGYLGTGTFIQSGSSVNSADADFYVANQTGSSGNYELESFATLNVAGNEYVGYTGFGSFTQSGSNTNDTVTGFLSIAANGGTGSFVLSGGTATAANIYVGGGVNPSGKALVTVNGGNLVTNGNLLVYDTTGTNLTLSSGSITAGSLTLRQGNTGLFTWTGGSLTITNDNIEVDNSSSANLASGQTIGPNQSLTVSGFFDAEIIGGTGTGSISQTGGFNNIPQGFLYVGLTGATGTYTLSGTGEVTASYLYMNSGASTFNQSGGTVNVGGEFYMEGTYLLSGGQSILNGALEAVGYGGTGVFNQSAGTNVSAYLIIGGGGKGTYNLSGTGDVLVQGGLSVGNTTVGVFNQTGGSNTVQYYFYIGEFAGATGTYALSGTGSLLAQVPENVGFQGVGTFNQTGGTNTISGGNNLYVGEAAGGTGTYSLSSGSAIVSGSVQVSAPAAGTLGGVGTLTVSGGTLDITGAGTLSIFNVGASAVNLSGGTIDLGGLITNGMPSLFNWTSGTLSFNGSTTFDSGAAITSPADAFANALTVGAGENLTVNGNETLGGTGAFALTLSSGSVHYVAGTLTITPNGTITQNSGSTLYAADIALAGGNVNGTLTNQGAFTYQSGSFNGRLVNDYGGSVNFGASFTAGNGFQNYGTITLNPGQTVTDNGTGVDNLGILNLGGATLSGSGPVVNDYGGTLSGGGTINPQFTNNGIVNLSGALFLNDATAAINSGIVEGAGTIIGAFSNGAGGSIDVGSGNQLSISNAWTNSGLVTMEEAGSLLNGGTITNDATIQGSGTIDSPISNSGVIHPTTGELDLGGAGEINSTAGRIDISTGNTVVFLQGLATNSGTIALSGGSFDNDSRVIVNSASSYISGWGSFASGGLSNSGFLYVGGNFNAYGAVTNGATGTINATGTGLNAFFGPVANSSGGTFSVQTGASVTFFNSYTGTAPVSNNGTVTFAAIGSSGPITGVGQIIVGAGAATSLQLVPNGGTSSQSSLIISNGSTVDVTNNVFLVNYGVGSDPIAAIRSYLAGGYNGGAWNGAGIDSSSVASLNASQSKLIYSVGYADGSDGITGVPSGEIEIMPTLAGDAKMQGNVVFGDFQLLSQYFGQSGTSWDEGNFTYGSSTDFGDFQLLSQNFGASASGLTAGEVASLDGFAAQFGDELIANPDGVGFSLVSVPEPAALAILATASLSVLLRRRRRGHENRR